MLSIQFLGSGDAFGSGGRFQTSIYLKTTNFNALIDCGASTPVAMKKFGVSTDDIDLIFISHFHGDHFGGLPFFILEAAKIARRKKKLRLISPPGLKDRLERLVTLLYPGSEEILNEVDIEYIPFNGKDEIANDLFKLETFPMQHMGEAMPHSLKIFIENKQLAFSGDTGMSQHLSTLANGSDLFICECNFFSYKTETHLNYKELFEARKGWKYKRMILSHLGNEILKNLDQVELETAEDGAQIYF